MLEQGLRNVVLFTTYNNMTASKTEPHRTGLSIKAVVP
jgi:hypothetical protein